jgi:hypothetical protein
MPSHILSALPKTSLVRYRSLSPLVLQMAAYSPTSINSDHSILNTPRSASPASTRSSTTTISKRMSLSSRRISSPFNPMASVSLSYSSIVYSSNCMIGYRCVSHSHSDWLIIHLSLIILHYSQKRSSCQKTKLTLPQVDIEAIESAMKMSALDGLRGYSQDHFGTIKQYRETDYVSKNNAGGNQVLREPAWNKGMPHRVLNLAQNANSSRYLVQPRRTSLQKPLRPHTSHHGKHGDTMCSGHENDK